MSIIDKRYSIKHGSFPNREKFLRRYKSVLKDRIKDVIDKAKIKDFNFKKTKIKLNSKDLDIPNLVYDPETGEFHKVFPGNKKYQRGDTFSKSSAKGKRAGGGQGSGEDDNFTFMLDEKEYADLFFSDLELPDLEQKQLASQKTELKKSGFCKYGSPNTLNIKKTMFNAIARKRALKKINKKAQYLEEADLRYNYKSPQEVPDNCAVMFCMLDVSGSMGENEKDCAKRFFILLNLFLRRHYDNVEVVFIRHAEYAKEVDEQEFFYGVESGGTVISSGYTLINQIIEDKYRADKWNIYIAQASDGDNWFIDNPNSINILNNSLLPKIQHLFYIELLLQEPGFTLGTEDKFSEILTKINSKKISTSLIKGLQDIYPVFRGFFSRKKHVTK